MNSTIPTVKVQPWGKGQGDYVEINEGDFDAKLHKLWTDPLDHDADGKKGSAKPRRAKASREETAGDPPLTRREIEADLTAMGEDFDPAADLDELRRNRDEARAILEG